MLPIAKSPVRADFLELALNGDPEPLGLARLRWCNGAMWTCAVTCVSLRTLRRGGRVRRRSLVAEKSGVKRHRPHCPLIGKGHAPGTSIFSEDSRQIW